MDDWIKMRGALVDHPKVIAMSRSLMEDRAFRDWLTPGGAGPLNGQIVSDAALRYVTCGALLRVWSSARAHGKFDGSDLLLEHSRIEDLDLMAGVPGIGKAMQAVRWALRKSGVTLPNFLEFNVPMTGAERQRRYRERRYGSVTGSDEASVTGGDAEVTAPSPLPLVSVSDVGGGGAGGGGRPPEAEALSLQINERLGRAMAWSTPELWRLEEHRRQIGPEGVMAAVLEPSAKSLIQQSRTPKLVILGNPRTGAIGVLGHYAPRTAAEAAHAPALAAGKTYCACDCGCNKQVETGLCEWCARGEHTGGKR